MSLETVTGIQVGASEAAAIEKTVGLESVDEIYRRLEANNKTHYGLNKTIKRKLKELDGKSKCEENDEKILDDLLRTAKREYEYGKPLIEEANIILGMLGRAAAETPAAAMLIIRVQARRNILGQNLDASEYLQYEINGWLYTL